MKNNIEAIEIALSELNDNELGLLQECRELQKAGFSEDEAQDLMGTESFNEAKAIMRDVAARIEELSAPPLLQLVARSRKKRNDLIIDMDSGD